MPGATSALFEPVLEREVGAIPAAARAFLETHTEEELWIAIARFAVLAHAPSQHSKRAVMAARAAYDVRGALGAGWVEMLIECARYAAESRPPWSEPPFLDPPPPDRSESLRDAIAAGDRLRAERWLSAHLEDAEVELRELARGDALLVLDAALALEQHLGRKGRYTLLRMVLTELLAATEHVSDPLEVLVARAIEERGSVDAVRAVFIKLVEDRHSCLSCPFSFSRVASSQTGQAGVPVLHAYPLARDYAQTLIAHAVAHKLPARADEFLAAVHHNLQNGESYAEWSFA